MNSIPEEIRQMVRDLKGLECWYVSSGGAAGTTFQMALGGKVERSVPLKSRAHSEQYRHFQGEFSLLVWCAWRLDGADHPLTSWDDAESSVETGLSQLAGTHITSLDVVPPAWDLNIGFSNSYCLRIFCDHVPGDASFQGNWDLCTRKGSLAVGPGAIYKIEERVHLSQEA